MFLLTSRQPPRPLAPGPAPRPGRPPNGPHRPIWPAPAAFGLAAVALGGAVQVNYGQYDPAALCWLTVALLATVAGCRSTCRTAANGLPAGPVTSSRRSPADFVLLIG